MSVTMFLLSILACAPSKIPPVTFSPSQQAKQNESGLSYQILRKGKGTNPSKDATVTVHYNAWTTDGKNFDSSYQRGKPATFSLTKVITGWQEGVSLMRAGGYARFWIPEELAYKGRPGTPQGTLIFDIELISFFNPPTLPENTQPPPKAKKTDSGIYYLWHKKGKNTTASTAKNRVSVHYAAWTMDGNMFDSSYARGNPITFGLQQVIPGWKEAIMMMSIGDKARFWIPEELTYKGQAGKPQGTLIFDIELLEVHDSYKR